MRKWVILVVLALVVGLVTYRTFKPPKVPNFNPPANADTESQLEERFKLNLPDNSEKAELNAVSGGDASGIASRTFEGGKYSLVVLADLPDLENGKFYQVLLEKGNAGEAGYTPFLVGKMSFQKGGYVLEFESTTNYMDFQRVVVKGETILLTGSFSN